MQRILVIVKNINVRNPWCERCILEVTTESNRRVPSPDNNYTRPGLGLEINLPLGLGQTYISPVIGLKYNRLTSTNSLSCWLFRAFYLNKVLYY